MREAWKGGHDTAPRQCPLCGFIALPGPMFEDDGAPPVRFCPSCGVELERLACRSCDAPLMLRRTRRGPAPAPHCAFCGAETRLREPRMRRRPRPRRARPMVKRGAPAGVRFPLTEADARRLLRDLLDERPVADGDDGDAEEGA